MKIPCFCENPACKKPFFSTPGNIARGYGRYCSAPCKNKCFYTQTPLDVRFRSRVNICEHGEDCPFCCHEWLGTTNKHGYGVINMKIDGRWKTRLVHRVWWERVNQRSLPPGLDCLHHCDNPPCSNVWHLRPGTEKDNIGDAKRRGRLATIQPKLRGERNVNAKLKETDIPMILDLRAQGWTLRKIATYFHVSRTTLAEVVHGTTWQDSALALPRETAGQVHLGIKVRAEDIAHIFEWHAKGETRTRIAERLHISRHAVGRVLSGKTRKHLTQPFFTEPCESNQVVELSLMEHLPLPLPSGLP